MNKREKQNNNTISPQTPQIPAKTIEQEECGICFEKIKIRGVLDSCSHYFCFECIRIWSLRANTCPLCKARFRKLTELKDGENSTVVKVPHRDQAVDDSFYIEAWSDLDPLELNGSSDVFQLILSSWQRYSGQVIELLDDDEDNEYYDIELDSDDEYHLLEEFIKTLLFGPQLEDTRRRGRSRNHRRGRTNYNTRNGLSLNQNRNHPNRSHNRNPNPNPNPNPNLYHNRNPNPIPDPNFRPRRESNTYRQLPPRTQRTVWEWRPVANSSNTNPNSNPNLNPNLISNSNPNPNPNSNFRPNRRPNPNSNLSSNTYSSNSFPHPDGRNTNPNSMNHNDSRRYRNRNNENRRYRERFDDRRESNVGSNGQRQNSGNSSNNNNRYDGNGRRGGRNRSNNY